MCKHRPQGKHESCIGVGKSRLTVWVCKTAYSSIIYVVIFVLQQ